MSSTSRRVEELLDRWLASVELHLQYLTLNDAAYARVEAWPKHQRPNALVVNLARARLLELKSHLTERRDAGDTRFAESLELMAFLTSLLGSEHIERFIPLATGKPVDTGISATIEQPRIRAPAKSATHQPVDTGISATVEQPRIRAPAKSATHQPAEGERRPSVAPTSHTNGATVKSASGLHRRPSRAPARTSSPAAATPPVPARSPAIGAKTAAPRPPASAPVGDVMVQQVLADAVRMLQWGREWPAIAGLIARMADRPSEADIWKILRAHRSQLLDKSRRNPG